jgi:hypothetical protein
VVVTRTTKKQRARNGLSLALRILHDAEKNAGYHAKMLARLKRELATHRENVRACTEDARKAGVL